MAGAQVPAAVLALSREYDLLPAQGKVLCAVSGGADSMCLLHLLEQLSPTMGFTLEVAHFNHQLRGGDAQRDARFVQAWCAQRNIPFHLGQGDVAQLAAQTKRGVEETARRLRYAFLRETAQRIGANRIATAHNAEDNGETLLLHLVRGCGLSGLTGIAPRQGELVRPLLSVSREDIAAYNAKHGVPHVEDATNGDIRYTRNFLRLQVVPLLRQLNPNLTQTLSRAAVSLRGDNDLLNARAYAAISQAECSQDTVTVPLRAITGQPFPLRPRIVQLLVSKLDAQLILSAAHRQAVIALAENEARPSGELNLPGGITARREYGRLMLTKRTAQPPLPEPVILTPPCAVEWGDHLLVCTPMVYQGERQRPNLFYLRQTPQPPLLRPRQPGDTLHPVGRVNKTVKKWMVEEKLPRPQRDRVPVLQLEGQAAAVAGLGADVAFVPAVGDAAWQVAVLPVLQDTPAESSDKS